MTTCQPASPAPLCGMPPVRAELAEVIRFLHAQGWTPATSSNFSHRTEAGFAISVSGLDKGAFSERDFLAVDPTGALLPGENGKPSAETLLHALAYRFSSRAQVVLHTHSVNGTVLSKLYEPAGEVVIREFEILKGLAGITTHQTALRLPVFPNDQDMAALATQVETRLNALREASEPVYGFLLAGHGLYTWGSSLAEAKRHVETFEFLFECILKLKHHGYPHYS